jgi:hypothetical protein
MSVSFLTAGNAKLLGLFNNAIEQTEQKGKITTWVRSDDKIYYTHKALEWNKKAWFKAVLFEGQLKFAIIKPKNANIGFLVYAYYHGHIIETFLRHFDTYFSDASASSMPTSDDLLV